MKQCALARRAPLCGEGQVVKADETYTDNTEETRVSPQRGKRAYKGKGGVSSKRPILSLIERLR